MSAIIAALRETETKQNEDRAFNLKFRLNGVQYRGSVSPPAGVTGHSVSRAVEIVGGFVMHFVSGGQAFVSVDAVAACEIEWLDGRD